MNLSSNSNRNTLKYEYSVCTVIFGTDTTILNVPLKDGFTFVRRSLIPKMDHLDSVFDTTDIGLRRAYETARIDSDTLDVICVEKHVQILLEKTALQEWYDAREEQDLVLLDNQIRAIRLFCECSLHYKSVSFKMVQEKGGSKTTIITSVIPISESAGTREISKFHCESNDVPLLHEKITHIVFPIGNDILNIAHQYYDLSYHQENFISITLLIIALEMIFLAEDTGKKDRLSKRCAVFMYDTKEDRVSCYTRLLAAYKQRSRFVHDGVFIGIEDETILFLRNCVRVALISIDPTSFEKKKLIDSLKRKVEETDYWKVK